MSCSSPGLLSGQSERRTEANPLIDSRKTCKERKSRTQAHNLTHTAGKFKRYEESIISQKKEWKLGNGGSGSVISNLSLNMPRINSCPSSDKNF